MWHSLNFSEAHRLRVLRLAPGISSDQKESGAVSMDGIVSCLVVVFRVSISIARSVLPSFFDSVLFST
jgi:hypothetical protein